MKKKLFFFFKFLFIYLWLCWIFISVRGLSLVVASGVHSLSQCVGLSLSWPLLLWSTGSRHSGSVIVAHGPSCSVACGIFPDQGSNPCPLHWQADSQPLRHQGSPKLFFFDDIRYSVLGNKCFYSSCSRALRWHLVSEDQANCEHLYRFCETLVMVLVRAL